MDTQLNIPTRSALLAVLAFAAAAVALLSTPQGAQAGAYTAWECAGRHGGPAGTPDVGNNNGGNTSGTAGSWIGWNDCSSGQYHSGVGIDGSAGASQGTYRAWDTFAPSGTRFTGGYFDSMGCTQNGVQNLYSYGNGSFLQAHILETSPGCAAFEWHGFSWSTPYGDTNQFVHWLYCHGNPCSGGGGVMTSNMIFNLVDYSGPSPSLGGSLTGGGWRSSGGTFDVSGSDAGSGVYFVDQYVNGSHIRRDFGSCSLVSLFGGTVGTSMRPCPSSAGSGGISYGIGSFQQGANTLTGCAYDFATDGNYNGNCTSTTVHVDTIAPGGVGSLAVAGGSGWRPNNDFDLSWSNPAQNHAPVDGAYYRVTRVGGGYDSGAQFVSGSNRNALSDLTVPSAGEYQVKVWLRDSAGNHSESNAQTTTLRYDPTVPPAAEAQFNGWIRRNDFEASADWDPVNPGQLGPSGLDGYAVQVTKDPGTDPCVTPDHQSPSCSAAEVNNDGINDTDMPITEKEEGDWYIHVAPVTGAGVKAPVKHTPMPVDTSDPSSSINGANGEWTNKDVTVGVTASDPLSGMSPNPSYSMDPQPRTCLQLDGGAPDCEPDADLTRVISSEGEHTVAYFARDLAGNENSGVPEANGKQNNPPGTAAVRIDKTAPQLAFAGARDVNDPAKIVVGTADALSGVAGGTVELRKVGSSGSWAGLATSLEGANLVARVPDDVEPGRYEFRATATDRAGNTGATDRRADGSQMVEELPLKEAVRLTATVEGAADKPGNDSAGKKCKGKKAKKKCKCKNKPKGKCKKAAEATQRAVSVTIPYGERVRLSGVLRTMGDAPLRGRELVVTERMAEGGQPAVRTSTASTNSDGGYAIDLSAGPSRRVTVTFEGDGRYRPTESEPVDVGVKGAVLAFSSSKTVPETKSIRFRGRVGTAGAALGQQGKRVELQYEKSRGNWKTIDSGQTNADGAFKLRYGLRANYVRRTKVRFRVAVPPEGSWPFVGTATSKPRKTVILP
jgi:hypothetical protein